MKPKISVVIPIRNKVENLHNAVKSLIRQNLPKSYLEIIVIDYGGDDDSKNMLDKFKDKRIKYLYVPEKGPWNLPRARNIGIRLSKGELVASMDADAILGKNALKEIYYHFKKTKKSVLYQMQRVDLKEGKIFRIHPPGVFLGMFQATDRKNWFNVRGFDERMTGYGWEDGDLVVRMNRIGVFSYWLSPKIKMYHQYHEESPGEETYVNLLKSKLNFSYKANDENWGFPKKRKLKLSEKLWRIFDRIIIYLLIRPIKRLKRIFRKIRKN